MVSKTEECNGEQNDCSYASELIHDFLSSSSAQCDLNNAGLRATFYLHMRRAGQKAIIATSTDIQNGAAEKER